MHVVGQAEELRLLTVEDNHLLLKIDLESPYLGCVETEFRSFLGGAHAFGANTGPYVIMGDDDIAAFADPRRDHYEPALDPRRVAGILLAEALLRARQDRGDTVQGFEGKLIACACGPPDDIEIILAEISLVIGAIVLDGEPPPRFVHVNNLASCVQYGDVRRDAIQRRDDAIFGDHQSL